MDQAFSIVVCIFNVWVCPCCRAVQPWHSWSFSMTLPWCNSHYCDFLLQTQAFSDYPIWPKNDSFLFDVLMFSNKLLLTSAFSSRLPRLLCRPTQFTVHGTRNILFNPHISNSSFIFFPGCPHFAAVRHHRACQSLQQTNYFSRQCYGNFAKIASNILHGSHNHLYSTNSACTVCTVTAWRL